MMQDIGMKLNPVLPCQKQHSTRRKLFTRKFESNLRNKVVKCYIRNIAFHGAETWKLRKLDNKYLESFEVWCCSRVEEIGWTRL
jgi:hypothetical protein